MGLPERRFEHHRVVGPGRYERTPATGRQKLRLAFPAMADAVTGVQAAMQPKHRNTGAGTPPKELRVQRLMARAGPPEPADIEIERRPEQPRPHTRTGNGEDSVSGSAER